MKGKKILLGVCGSISAYKSVLLLRLLKRNGADVKVIMTSSATNFVGPLTFSTLSQNLVLTELIHPLSGIWVNHVELGLWADAMIIAPISCNTLAKLATGICDNLLCSVYLSARCPVFVAPAMDSDMFTHPSVVKNLEIVKSYGNTVISPDVGELASGLFGPGRLAEPERIYRHLVERLT